MLISSSVSLPVDTKDTKEAVYQVLDMIQSKTTTLDNIKISVSLISSTFPDIMVLLAKALPEKVKCFGVGYSTSAGEFIKTYEGKKLSMPDSCNCDLTDYFSITDSITLIKSFFKASPRAIRSTYFGIRAENLNWLGTQNVGTGTMWLFQFRKKFSLSVTYSCHGKSKKDETVKALYGTIFNETGIQFNKGVIIEGTDPEILKKADTEHIFTARICFEEVFGQAGQKIRSLDLKWNELPGICSKDESFNRRMESIRTGKKESVNFGGMTRRFMKEKFPEFEPLNKLGDQAIYSKVFSEDIRLIFGFEKMHFWGMGKTFTLLLGIKITQGVLQGRSWTDNYFRLYQQSSPPCCAYTTKEELSYALSGVEILLKKILPVFEEELKRYFCPIPETIPASVIQRGAITAKHALEEALSSARLWSIDAHLYSVGSSGILYMRDMRENGMGPMIDVHGTLRPHGNWCYAFYSPSKKRILTVLIPSMGMLHMNEWEYSQPFDNIGVNIESLEINKWMDSDRAMAIAEEHGGQEARNNAYSNWDIITTLDMSPNPNSQSQNVTQLISNNIFKRNTTTKKLDPRWSVRYLLMETEKSRKDFEISFNALDGKEIEAKRY